MIIINEEEYVPNYRMRTGRAVIIGVAFLLMVITLLVITYVLNKDLCSKGTFRCGNSSKCIPQRSICNKHRDCPNGEDESGEFCADLLGSHFVKQVFEDTKPLHHLNKCDLRNIPKGCLCRNKTHLNCKSVGLKKVPTGITGNLTRLILANNTITNLEGNAFDHYKTLNLIHLEGNDIKVLPTKTFQNQESLTKLLLMNNHIRSLSEFTFNGTYNLTMLFFQNNCLKDSDLAALNKVTKLEYLDLSNNSIQLKIRTFPPLNRLKELLLEGNQIEEITSDTFSKLNGLQYLNLRKNKIIRIGSDAFRNTVELREFDLSHNFLSTLGEDVFSGLTQLNKLFMGHNPFHYLSGRLFIGLHNLASLNLQEIELSNFDLQTFLTVDQLKFIYLKKFYYCSFVPMVPVCEPKSDGVSTLEDLLGTPILRVSVWVVAVFTCIGNIYVFWGRIVAKDENRVLSCIVRNLAVADFAMGIYLVVIGVKDIEFRGVYNRKSHEWISSWTCTIIGAVAMMSSEVSIFILVFMSLERFLLIAVPLGRHQNLTFKTCCFSLGIIWTFGLFLAILPIVQWRNSTKFYGANGMCFPLHIDDPYFAGWQYSAFVFIGINFLGILIIAFLYSGMFWSIWKTRHATTLNFSDFEFAIRFFFIVLTNTVCWAPVIVLKMLALFRIHISDDVYSWISVFIIPVNSAFNPLLYTLTTPKYREVIRYSITRRVKFLQSSRHQISTSDTTSHTSSSRHAPGFSTVSVLSGGSKGNSFDMPTFNTSLDRTSSTTCEDFYPSSQSTGQDSRGNSFDMPSASFDHYSSFDNFFRRDSKCDDV